MDMLACPSGSLLAGINVYAGVYQKGEKFMKKRYLAMMLAVAATAGAVWQPVTVSAAVDDEDQALAPIEELTAGGFYVKENCYIDTENNAFFVADTTQDAMQVIDTYDLDAEACVISEEMGDGVVVQTDLTSGQAQALERDARVSQVEDNYMVYGCSDESAETAGAEMTQWYLDAMNVDRNMQGISGEKVKVELLDSGVSYVSALEDVERVDLTTDSATGAEGFTEVLFNDNSGHGTAMAGLIAANSPDGSLTGINPNAELYSVRILDENLQAPISKVIEGIYWGIEHQVDIINMSFGTEVNSEALHNAVQAASDAGILLIAAAGNNESKGILYPAAYPEVIAVGATTSEGTVLSGTASGTELELLAPGNQIISTGMVDGYSSGSGTSLATAEVTGVASLLLGQPGATADVVRGLLRATAKDVEGSNAGLVDYGYAEEHFAEYLAAFQNNEVDEAGFDNPTVPETYDTEGIVNGLWLAKAHIWLADKANETAGLNNTYLTLVKQTAEAADNGTYHPSNHKKYTGLHGLGLYTANFYALWKYANFINKGNSVLQAKTNALASLPSGALDELKKMEDGKKEYTTANFLDACGVLMGKEGNGKTNAQKKYLLVGFGCHMIGDIYAHRTLVPQYAVDNAQLVEIEKYPYASGSSTDFKSYLIMSDFKDWDVLENYYNGETNNVPNKLLFTFPLLKNYAANQTNFNQKYEDKTDFCRERLNAALKCTKEFLSRISSSDNNVATVSIIQEQTNVSLIHYNTYMSYF